MNKYLFEKYINNEFTDFETEQSYSNIMQILEQHLDTSILLEVEELLNAALLAKLEVGFNAGYNSALSVISTLIKK